MIEIKQRSDKWRLKINEELEFETFNDMYSVLQDLILLKRDHAQIFQSGGRINQKEWEEW